MIEKIDWKYTKYRNYRNIRTNIQAVIDAGYTTKKKKLKWGEVFTPFALIEEMVTGLIECDSEARYNPKFRWLDPCAGLGNMMCVVMELLMGGLADWEPNEGKRYKHIMENQIYQVEINPESVAKIQEIYNPDGKYKLNLVCADVLDRNHSGWDGVGYHWDSEDKRIRNIKRKFIE